MTDSAARSAERDVAREPDDHVARSRVLVDRCRVDPPCEVCEGKGTVYTTRSKGYQRENCTACAESGQVLLGRFRLAAFLGDPAAQLATGWPAWAEDLGNSSLYARPWTLAEETRPLAGWGPAVQTRAAVAAAWAVIPLYERYVYELCPSCLGEGDAAGPGSCSLCEGTGSAGPDLHPRCVLEAADAWLEGNSPEHAETWVTAHEVAVGGAGRSVLYTDAIYGVDTYNWLPMLPETGAARTHNVQVSLRAASLPYVGERPVLDEIKARLTKWALA